jgi:ribosomal protein S18 acetylase RimI-like enzyme
LWYLRHDLGGWDDPLPDKPILTYRAYHANPALFHETLLHSYEETRDCPELNGVRTLEEIIDGHKAQGIHSPDRWWLALDADRPVGVILVTEIPDWQGWDLSYIGVVPEARRRGIGRALTRKVLSEARRAAATQLTLAVDARNRPAWNLYLGLGFEPFDQREVYLAIWGNPGGVSGPG